MTRLALLLLLATPASAATVALDPGDTGLIWTAEGFRPADGIDTYAGKINPPALREPISPCVPAYRDDWPLGYSCGDMGLFTAALPDLGQAVAIASASASSASYSVSHGGFGGSGGTYIGGTSISLTDITIVDVDVTILNPCGCVDAPEPPVIVAPPVVPETPIAPVPLPASGLLLMAGLLMLKGMKRCVSK